MPTREELLKRLEVLLDDLPKPWADEIRAVAGDLVCRERERCAVIAEIAATHALGNPCRIIAQRIRIDPAKGE